MKNFGAYRYRMGGAKLNSKKILQKLICPAIALRGGKEYLTAGRIPDMILHLKWPKEFDEPGFRPLNCDPSVVKYEDIFRA